MIDVATLTAAVQTDTSPKPSPQRPYRTPVLSDKARANARANLEQIDRIFDDPDAADDYPDGNFSNDEEKVDEDAIGGAESDNEAMAIDPGYASASANPGEVNDPDDNWIEDDHYERGADDDFKYEEESDDETMSDASASELSDMQEMLS